jgi:hypothetical protein
MPCFAPRVTRLVRIADRCRLALKPYRGTLAVRNCREGDGNVGIMRSPVRAIALPDRPDRLVEGTAR